MRRTGSFVNDSDESYHAAVRDTPEGEIHVLWSTYGHLGRSTPRDRTPTFERRDENGKLQKLTVARVQDRGEDRFFIVSLPGGAVRIWRQPLTADDVSDGGWVDSIAGGDPA
jgi:hypothetical protein